MLLNICWKSFCFHVLALSWYHHTMSTSYVCVKSVNRISRIKIFYLVPKSMGNLPCEKKEYPQGLEILLNVSSKTRYSMRKLMADVQVVRLLTDLLRSGRVRELPGGNLNMIVENNKYWEVWTIMCKLCKCDILRTLSGCVNADGNRYPLNFRDSTSD